MAHVDAAVLWDNGKAYFFRGSEYLRYDVAADQVDQDARPIADGWAGVFPDGVDAAVLWNNGKAYFFRGSEYVRYDVASDQVDQDARPIADGWPGVFPDGVDEAVLWNNGKAYLFRGSEYVRYDVAADQVDQDARPIADGWAGVFPDGIDAAELWNNGKAYFFRGSEYVRYDVAADQVDQDARPIADGWPGLTGAAPGPSPTPTPTPTSGATADLSDGFFVSVRSTSAELGCNPIDLLSVMMSESGVKATAHNANGHASGLIQFMPATLERLGWTAGHEAFRQLDAEAQMPFVKKYFAPFAKKGLTSGARLYQATFLPATLDDGSDAGTVLVEQGGKHDFAYGPNKGLDTDKDGTITVGELQQAIDRNAKGPRWNEILSRLGA
jgi:hypothetical protein